MSDNWIVLVPEDPHFVPDSSRIAIAQELLSKIAPDADEIEVTETDKVRFFDCGGNFERILCPSCHAEILDSWWQGCLKDDWTNGEFQLAKYLTPCCNSACTLHELHYEWPQGFGRFALEAMNPNIGKLDDRYRAEFESILGTQLRIIYQHI